MTSSEYPTLQTWHRVSPVSIVYFLLKSIGHIVNLWPALIPLIALGEGFRSFFWNYFIFVVGAVFLFNLFISYWFFRFREEQDCIQIRSGLLNRTRLTLNYDRVQQADIVQPFYFRPFGLATLGLESAGSTHKEVSLPGIPYTYAERLKRLILEHKEGKVDGEKIEMEAHREEEEASYRLILPPLEVARYGLMHNGLIFLLPLIAPLTQNPEFFRRYLSPLENTWLFNYLFNADHQDHFWRFIASIFFMGGVFIAILFAASVFAALFRFWNYDLRRRGDQFQYRAGLATISTRGFRLHKLQKVVINQGIVARLLKRYTLAITKAGTVMAQEGTPQADKQHFLVPVLDDAKLKSFMAELNLPTAEWQPISKFYIAWTGGWNALLLGGSMLTVFVMAKWSPLWVLIFVIMLFLIAWRRWYCWGFYHGEQHDEQWLAIKTGFIGRKITFVPAPKAQKTTVSQPPWLKYFSLAQITVWSGAGRVHIPCIAAEFANDLRDRLLWQISSFNKRWF